MATSADKLSTILEVALDMSEAGDTREKIMTELAKRELLPAKLLPKKKQTTPSIFASKQAEEAATLAKLALDTGAGSGKDGRYTLADINKMLETPKKKPVAVSPSALQLANEHGISISGVVGTGKEGRIILKDIENLLENQLEREQPNKLNISPRALNEAKDSGINLTKLKTLHGSGKDGRVVLSDIEKLKSSSESSSESDSDSEEDEKPRKTDKKKKN